VQTGLPQVWPAKSYKCATICLEGGKRGKQRRSWIKPAGNCLSCSYRECIKFSAFRACVSQRSVNASSSALNCSQVSLLGAPIKPVSRENIFAEAQKGSCMTLHVEWQRAAVCVLNPVSPTALLLALVQAASLCPLPRHSKALPQGTRGPTAAHSYTTAAQLPSSPAEQCQSPAGCSTPLKHLSWSYHKACMGSEQEDKSTAYNRQWLS